MLHHLTDVSLRSLLLALPAAMLLLLLRRRATAALQHAVWAAVVCGMLALFAFGQALPRLPLRVLDSVPAPAQAIATVSDAPTQIANLPAVQSYEPANAPRPIDWRSLVFFVYSVIALGFLARFAIGIFMVRKLIQSAHPVCAGGDNNVYESHRLSVPVTAGWLRPRILLSPDWREWPQEKLQAVIAHEGAHVRRRDGLISTLAGINRCLFWFHPLAWILESKLAVLAEQACDESSVVALGDRNSYACLLLEMASVVDASHGRLRHHALTMAAGSHIRQRIDSLLEEGRTFSRGLTWTGWTAILLCGIPVVLCAGAVEVTHQPPLLKLEMPRWTAPAPPLMEPHRPAEEPVQLAQADKAVPAAAPSQSDIASDATLTFAVVSIKPAPPDDGRNMVTVHGGVGEADASQVSYGNITLLNLIGRGYTQYPKSELYQVIGPGWLMDDARSPHFDVIAKIPPGTTQQQFQIMMRNMLADRFGMKVHFETREFAGYDLVVAKGGPKLKEAAPLSSDSARPDISNLELDQNGFPKLNYPTWVVHYINGPNGIPVARMTARAQPVSAVLAALRAATRRPVRDKTGLTGKYDFTLEYGSGVATLPDASSAGSAQAPDPGVPDIRYAIRSLGLAVEPTKVTLGVLVVDRIEKSPTEN